MQAKKYFSLFLFTILLLSAFMQCSSVADASGAEQTSAQLLNEAGLDSTEDLSEAESKGLIFMREEEKLARDVYLTLYNLWGLRVFTNISKSEQTHMNAIKSLLDKYEITDPVVNNDVGVFTNSDLHALFGTLKEQGSQSEVEALKVGALIEEIDIRDIRLEIDEHVDSQDVIWVYENLLNGSYNHLRAFVRNLQSRGVFIYTAGVKQRTIRIHYKPPIIR